MASSQEKQNRRLLEELAQTKQMLISQGGGAVGGGGSGGGGGAATGGAPTNFPGMLGSAPGGGNALSSASRMGASLLGNGIEVTDAQRNARVTQALQAANTNSVGFFVPQDSSFGNLILPVLPRISPGEPPAPS